MSYQGVNPRPGAALPAHQTQIDDNALVENRITGLLSQNNPYMQQAETRGLQQANQRGLLSSSMAVGAVEGQRIAAALPIASQDASLYGQANLQDSRYMQQGNLNNQAYGNQASLADQSYGNQRGINTQAFGFNTQLNQQQADINSRLQGEAFDYNRQLATQQGQIQSGLADQGYAHQTQLSQQQHSQQMAHTALQGDMNANLQMIAQQGGLTNAMATIQAGIMTDQSIPEPAKLPMIQQIGNILTGHLATQTIQNQFIPPALMPQVSADQIDPTVRF